MPQMEFPGLTAVIDPPRDCPLCPRLVEFIQMHRVQNPSFFNAPVPSWFPDEGRDNVQLLIVGLAPGLKGANRTGRPFTGDYAGDLLYETLVRHGFAKGNYGKTSDDSLALVDCAITNAVRCVPPQNKPIGAEINACRQFLTATMDHLPKLKIVVTLGKIAHDTFTRHMGERVAAHAFGHNRQHEMTPYTVISSYHCSRYNTNTGVLTPKMFDEVFVRVREQLETLPNPPKRSI